MAATELGSDAFVASLAILCIFGGPVALFLAWRYFAHKERIAMINAGMMPGAGIPYMPPPRAPQAGDPPQTVFIPNQAACQASLAKGIRTAFIGLALLIGLSFIGYNGDGHWSPGPWLLGGLVPLFVGLAQIVTAVMSGATFGAWGVRPPEPPLYSVPNPPNPSNAPPPSPGASPNFSGPYAYRPPSDVTELPKTNPPKTR